MPQKLQQQQQFQSQLLLLVALNVVFTACATTVVAEKQQLGCAWGGGVAVPQPLAPAGAPNLTCTPPAVVGAGTTSLDLVAPATAEPGLYMDAQLFSYRPKPPPRGNGRVRVALLPMGGADGRSNLSTSLQYLTKAGELGTDLAVLPENFAQKHVGKSGDMDPPPQNVNGFIISAVAALARQYKMNVVAPIREKRGNLILNTAVVLDRNGSVAGRYSKLFPVLGPPDVFGPGGREEQVYPSQNGVIAVDLDFGRVSLAICFDINFAEVWHQAASLGADVMIWPSAMQTPDPFTYGYARIHQYHLIAVGHPGDVVDKDGTQQETRNVTGWPMMKLATLNIDKVFVHWDNNRAKMQKLLAEQAGKVVVDIEGPPFWLLRSVVANVSARQLVKQYGIETAREYAVRSRRGLNVLRQHGQPVPGVL